MNHGKINPLGSHGFKEIHYRSKRVKAPKLYEELLVLEMPKKLKGLKTIFPIRIGYKELGNIEVPNFRQIKRILVIIKR